MDHAQSSQNFSISSMLRKSVAHCYDNTEFIVCKMS
jgi:hypothetical protein